MLTLLRRPDFALNKLFSSDTASFLPVPQKFNTSYVFVIHYVLMIITCMSKVFSYFTKTSSFKAKCIAEGCRINHNIL